MTTNVAILIFTITLLGLFALKVLSINYNDTGDRLYSKEVYQEDLNSFPMLFVVSSLPIRLHQ